MHDSALYIYLLKEIEDFLNIDFTFMEFREIQDIIWASLRENLSSGFPTKRVSKQSPQLQRLARKLKFHL